MTSRDNPLFPLSHWERAGVRASVRKTRTLTFALTLTLSRWERREHGVVGVVPIDLMPPLAVQAAEPLAEVVKQ